MCGKSKLTSLPRKNWDNIVGYDVTIRVQEIRRVVNNLEQKQSLFRNFIKYLAHFEKYPFLTIFPVHSVGVLPFNPIGSKLGRATASYLWKNTLIIDEIYHNFSSIYVSLK